MCKGSSAAGGEGLFLQPSNRCAVSEPVSATPASVLRTLANPLCKGSSAAGGEGLFFYNPPTAARFPNPSRRRLQACFAHSQIPCVKGAPPQAVRDCFFTTLQPLRGFRTRLGDAFIINLRLRRTASLRFSLLSLLSKKLPRLRGGIFHIIFV